MCSTDDVVVRRLADGDAMAVSRLIGHTAFVSNRHEYPQSVLRDLAGWYSPEHILEMAAERIWLVAESDGAILGTVALVRPAEGANSADVASFFITPSAQRQGLGRRLLAAIEDEARALGVSRLVCDSSLTARGFYESMGWTELQVRDQGDGDVCVDMERVLS